MSGDGKNQKMLWMPVCMSMGIGLGMLIGSLCGQIPAGLCMGIGCGLAAGGIIDYKTRKSKG